MNLQWSPRIRQMDFKNYPEYFFRKSIGRARWKGHGMLCRNTPETTKIVLGVTDVCSLGRPIGDWPEIGSPVPLGHWVHGSSWIGSPIVFWIMVLTGFMGSLSLSVSAIAEPALTLSLSPFLSSLFFVFSFNFSQSHVLTNFLELMTWNSRDTVYQGSRD
jgi:hypothetical protein